MKRAPHRQSGVSVLLVVLVVFVLIAVVIASRSLTRTASAQGRENVTSENLQRIADAITTFAAANKYLPCPAPGADATGTASPNIPATATATACTDPAGVVPWGTLALRREDAVDGWGRKISYRVAPGFTSTTALDTTACNNAITSPIQNLATPPATGRCGVAHMNTLGQFYAFTPMLSVNDLGTLQTNVAFVLISHGVTGGGAFGAEGTVRGGTLAATGNELANTQGASPFWIAQRSDDATVDVTSPAHFDDVVLYRKISDFAGAIKLADRTWPLPPASTIVAGASQGFSLAAIQATLGYTPPTNVGTNSYDTGVFTLSSSSGQNISFASGTSGQGIGAIPTGSSSTSAAYLDSTAADSLTFTLDGTQKASGFGITLVDFGKSGSNAERARFRFFNGATLVDTIVKDACQSGQVLANFSLNPQSGNNPALYNSVVVDAVTSSGGTASTYLIGAINMCAADGICIAPSAVPANNCP